VSVTYISTTLRRFVEQRATYQCEYCLLPNNVSFFPHEIDHIIPEKHGGLTSEENLAYTCWRCNRYKGTDLGSFDPSTGEFCFLFHPRSQQWYRHFIIQDSVIMGITPEGRTTCQLLTLNSDERIAERMRLNT
jgi:HNH endonuclease